LLGFHLAQRGDPLQPGELLNLLCTQAQEVTTQDGHFAPRQQGRKIKEGQ
jgi:hypothetical protein